MINDPGNGAAVEAGLSSSSIGEVRLLVRAHGVDASGAIEKAHLVDALAKHISRTPFAGDNALNRVAEPTSCAICMLEFVDAEPLR